MSICVYVYTQSARLLLPWPVVAVEVTDDGGGSGTRLIWTVGFCLSANKIWLPSVWITRNFELIRDTSIIIGPYNPFWTPLYSTRYTHHPQRVRIFVISVYTLSNCTYYYIPLELFFIHIYIYSVIIRKIIYLYGYNIMYK